MALEFGKQVEHHRRQRHSDDHAHKAPQSAEEQDGKQDPEAGKPSGVPQDLGAQDVSVKLLEYQDQPHKIQALPGAYEEHQHRAGNGSYEGAEKRDHVGNAHDNTDQKRKGQLKQVHQDKA